jgi:hypothetical protein
VTVTAAIAVGAGLITALVTNVIVGAYPGHFFAVWGVATLFVLAIGLPIAAFQVIFGIAGTAIGWILFLVIGNPASGGSSAPELLPGFWRILSQILPPGAAVTSLRDVVYFNAARGLSRPHRSRPLRGARRQRGPDHPQRLHSRQGGHDGRLNAESVP